MAVQSLIRKFEYKGVVLDDPNPSYSIEQVLEFYSAKFPEFVNAITEEAEIKGDVIYRKIVCSVGTKG